MFLQDEKISNSRICYVDQDSKKIEAYPKKYSRDFYGIKYLLKYIVSAYVFSFCFVSEDNPMP